MIAEAGSSQIIVKPEEEEINLLPQDGCLEARLHHCKCS